MGRFTDDNAVLLEANFQRRVPSYMSADINRTEYEEAPVGAGNIQPAGWVKNADPDIDGDASVTIDSSGITILNGKIFLEDYSGASALGPAGFDGSWIDFVQSNFFNGYFNGGDLSSGLTAETIVGSGLGDDFVASLSTDIPFWVIEDVTGSMTYGIEQHASFGRAFAVRKSLAAASTITFFSDVAVRGGIRFDFLGDIYVDHKEVVADTIEVFVTELDGNHDTFTGGDVDASKAEIDMSTYAAGTIFRQPLMFQHGTHQDTRYLRYKVVVTFAATAASHGTTAWFSGFTMNQTIITDHLYFPYVPSADPTANTYDIIRTGTVGLEMDFVYGLRGLRLNMASAGNGGSVDDAALRILRADDTDETFYISADGQMGWGSGSGARDVRLYRSGANVLSFANGDSLSFADSSESQAINVSDNYILFDDIASGSTEPSNPATGRMKLYVKTNGGTGKQELRARFDSGAFVVVATEP